VDISQEDWNWAVSSLQEHGLLLPADPHQAGVLDAHPLVRAYFQEELNNERSKAWQEGNLRLYEHLKGLRPELPETLSELELLFSAILHGCRAGRQQEALDEIYKQRIMLDRETNSGVKFGAIGSELMALSGFFDQPWDKPSIHLNSEDHAFVLNEAASDLRSLGRLREAVQPMQAGLDARIHQKDWEKAAISAGNLSGLTLTLGKVLRAVELGEQSVELADRSGDALQRMSTRATLADALQQAGQWEASAEACREAELKQTERQSSYPRLYGKWGYRYCDLVMSRAEPEDGSGLEGIAANQQQARRSREVCLEMQERDKQFLEWCERSGFLLSPLEVALDHLTLGRAHLGLALTTPSPEKPGEEAEAEFSRSAEHLHHAMDGLRQTGREDCLPWGLLGRATFRRFRGDLTGVAADLTEALEIAERDSMRLHECDAHLEWARLCLQQGNAKAARVHVAKARKIVNETGYRRREREVGWLERRLAGEEGDRTGALAPA
jgi:tetratricopeptide (TPR) repeat protein